MDGTFIELSSGMIEAELEEYNQEVYKVGKQLSNRAKKENTKQLTASTTDSSLEDGSLSSRNNNSSKQPNLFGVIAKVTESMKKFKV